MAASGRLEIDRAARGQVLDRRADKLREKRVIVVCPRRCEAVAVALQCFGRVTMMLVGTEISAAGASLAAL
jgi:hypothetical protein